jgi:signal transduction histidine kinase
MGCAIGLTNFLGFTIFLLALGWVANALGWIQSPFEPIRWVISLSVGLFLFLILFVPIFFLSLRRFSRPLDDLLSASDRVAEGDYSARVEEAGPREIRSLTRSFNSMAERLQANDRQRRDMLADVTHELRTPLTVIRGEVEGMLDGVYPTDETRLRSILEETQLLSRLVDDLRTLSLAEAGALELKREPTDVAALLLETVSAFRSAAEARGVRIEFSLADSPPVEIDPVRIREVIANLFSNALRYTPDGGVIRVEFDGASISVIDSGPGIPPEILPRIFDRFYKSSDSGGMGLGLAIAKTLVEAHGGTIRAENVESGGTRIIFTLFK